MLAAKERTEHKRKGLFQPDRRSSGGTPAPGAVFRASRKTGGRTNRVAVSDWQHTHPDAEREARSATPGAGVLPDLPDSGWDEIAHFRDSHVEARTKQIN